MALSVGHPRGTHSRYVIGCCLIPLGIYGLKNNSKRITCGIGCVWGMPSLSPLSSLGYNQLPKYLSHCTVFWHKWPVHDVVLVIPPPPLIKVASNTRPCSKLGGTTFNGKEEGGQYYISQTCDQQRLEARKVVFPWECLHIFATGCSSILYVVSFIRVPGKMRRALLWTHVK